MSAGHPDLNAAGNTPRRLFFYNAGFLRQPRLRRILALAGHDLRLGLPRPGDGVAVWGRSPHAARGEAVAAARAAPLIRLEDPFLRSVKPGRLGDAPLGLLIDPIGVHFDSSAPSAIETLLARHPLDDSNLLMRARDGIARLQALDLSKYNMHSSALPLPAPGYVLVIDQTAGDASIRHSGAGPTRFREMLVQAQLDFPHARIVIKTHPETSLGLRAGHYTDADATGRISLLTAAVSPWRLLEGAIAVYTVASQLGYEAILAGHRPRVFGQPFYCGWGLTEDAFPVARRQRRLTKTQVFAVSHILAPTWYDPCRDRLCSFEEATDQLEAEARAYREDRAGHIACGMRLWKRGRLQAVFGRHKPLIFVANPQLAAEKARAAGRGLLIWANAAPAGLAAPGLQILRVEDGFLRSRGLGAALTPPQSLVTDDLGIYYDPTRDSRLEHLIAKPPPAGGIARAERLARALIAARISKYNLAGQPPAPANQPHRILVPGQVEDDASIRLGCTLVATNLDLLRATRAANPAAWLIYKPHPDVEAGLRPGAIATETLISLADEIATATDTIALIEACDAVWTMTSLLGFEALIRGKPVTCYGAPFYAGWGLTRDLGPIPQRRLPPNPGLAHPGLAHPGLAHPGLAPASLLPPSHPRPSLAQLIHAALIAYPRYFDPVSRRPCPPEVAVERLANGRMPRAGLALRLLAKIQGRLATHATLWR